MKNFYKHIFFTKTKLGGVYRFLDIFQIYPLEIEGMPTCSIQKHFPNCIEFYISEEDKIKLQSPYSEIDELLSRLSAPVIKGDMFLSLITTCSNHLFFRYEDVTGNWALPIYDNQKSQDQVKESCWSVPHYGGSTINNFVIINFSKIGLEKIQEEKYYNYFFGSISGDEHYSNPITFPDIIDIFLYSYFNLDENILSKINTAMYHLRVGVELINVRKTLGLVSIFTSLETMVNLEHLDFKAQSCKECGQLKYSVRKKFRNYLSTYVSDLSENKRKFNKLYSLRSKIIHQGDTLSSELLYSDIAPEERNKENLEIREIIQICRVSIVNWVIKNKIM